MTPHPGNLRDAGFFILFPLVGIWLVRAFIYLNTNNVQTPL